MDMHNVIQYRRALTPRQEEEHGRQSDEDRISFWLLAVYVVQGFKSSEERTWCLSGWSLVTMIDGE
jgi:hypothetical protein